MKKSRRAFEKLYDAYSPMLYGFALKISPSASEAEIVLMTLFREIYDQKAFQRDHSSLALKFLKLLIRIAHDRFNPGRVKGFFKLLDFENTPMIHALFCEQISIDQYCLEYGMTRTAALKKLHQEYGLLQITSVGNSFLRTPDSLIRTG